MSVFRTAASVGGLDHLREIQYRRGQDQNTKEGEHNDDGHGIV
jgi:hypothetical protein